MNDIDSFKCGPHTYELGNWDRMVPVNPTYHKERDYVGSNSFAALPWLKKLRDIAVVVSSEIVVIPLPGVGLKVTRMIAEVVTHRPGCYVIQKPDRKF